MPIALGIDLGTTTITALAVDCATGTLAARATLANDAEIATSDGKQQGFSEWDAARITPLALQALRAVVEALDNRNTEVRGLGLTGQQHGLVLLNGHEPVSPLFNWQDRRAEQLVPGTSISYVEWARQRVGAAGANRAGCRLSAGYMGVTLLWLRDHGLISPGTKAAFLTDYIAALLTDREVVTDPTNGASSGVLDVARGDWDRDTIAALGLPQELFPPVRPSGSRLGSVTPAVSEATGLPVGLPVFVGIGDNQASFLGSVASLPTSVLVNVGTGGQVACHVADFVRAENLETRPFPGGGFLAVCAGLTGGRAYALLEGFFRNAGAELFATDTAKSLFPRLNALAEKVPSGCDGLTCAPFFTGTRYQPELRGAWTGLSPHNFTPGHLARSLLEGMARAFHAGYRGIERAAPGERTQLVGAGNGMRENPLLARIVKEAFGLPLRVPAQREEAAYGAALLAATGVGVFPNLQEAAQLIQYAEESVAG